jgi:hypothetical protein
MRRGSMLARVRSSLDTSPPGGGLIWQPSQPEPRPRHLAPRRRRGALAMPDMAAFPGVSDQAVDQLGREGHLLSRRLVWWPSGCGSGRRSTSGPTRSGGSRDAADAPRSLGCAPDGSSDQLCSSSHLPNGASGVS